MDGEEDAELPQELRVKDAAALKYLTLASADVERSFSKF